MYAHGHQIPYLMSLDSLQDAVAAFCKLSEDIQKSDLATNARMMKRHQNIQVPKTLRYIQYVGSLLNFENKSISVRVNVNALRTSCQLNNSKIFYEVFLFFFFLDIKLFKHIKQLFYKKKKLQLISAKLKDMNYVEFDKIAICKKYCH